MSLPDLDGGTGYHQDPQKPTEEGSFCWGPEGPGFQGVLYGNVSINGDKGNDVDAH